MRYARQSAIVFLITLSLLATACPKKTDVVFWAEQVVGSASDVITILAANGKDTTKAAQLRDYGQKLVAAIKANDGTALGYAASCIDVLSAVAGDATVITDPAKRTLALALLGIANRALHSIIDSLPPPATFSHSKSAATIAAFKAKKRWSCRSSVDGRYHKMEFCKANPATSTVEMN